MKPQELFLSEANKQKFLNEIPYLEEKDGFVDFCLGKNISESAEIFRQFLFRNEEIEKDE